VENGIGMGIAATFVLVCSNAVVAAVRKLVPDSVRIAVYIVIIASFVTIVDLLMSAYFRTLYNALGIFIPLIVVNCIILGRAEAFASKSSILMSIADGIGMGGGFTVALLMIGSVRELLGNGSILGYHLLGSSYVPMLVMILPPGAFLTYGTLTALVKSLNKKV
jgi:electron transport complex protein RnfE